MYRAHSTRARSAATRVIVVTALGLATGCFNPFAPKAKDVLFALSPNKAYMVVGDVMPFNTWSGRTGGSCRDGNVASNWKITGDAVGATLAGGSTTRTVSSRPRIFVRALAIGTSDIEAVASGDSTHSKTVRVTVADSSSISRIEVGLGYWQKSSVNAGKSTTLIALLMDGSNNVYVTEPQWSVSDTTILRYSAGKSCFGSYRDITGIRAGAANVIVTFRGVTGSLRVTVLP